MGLLLFIQLLLVLRLHGNKRCGMGLPLHLEIPGRGLLAFDLLCQLLLFF